MSNKLKEEVKEELECLCDEMLLNFIKLLHLEHTSAFIYLENILANYKAYLMIKGVDKKELLDELMLVSDEKADEIVRKILRKDKKWK